MPISGIFYLWAPISKVSVLTIDVVCCQAEGNGKDHV